ncbi:hypothetical protein N431DRAFT_543615 [Stipitochalara longipes BDJ]|nr:hypothetical protein N431DRAFT_543615 [Stipitochalara longipes BDJ]
MATENRLSVNLGKPLPDLNAHKCLYVHQGNERNALTISFKRTVRVPDNETTYQLPPNLGSFPLYNVAHYKETLPESMMLKGGCFMPVHEREALWIRFNSTRPFAIKILLGGINAISGEPVIETFATALRRARLLHEEKSIQDYVVIDPANDSQLWLDGIAKQNGSVMQFVAVPTGSGYSVEAQIANADYTGGIQIMVTPIKKVGTGIIEVKRLSGFPMKFRIRLSYTVFKLLQKISEQTHVPVEQMSLLYQGHRLQNDRLIYSYGIEDKSVLNLVLNLQGGGAVMPFSQIPVGEMSLGVGGLIKQAILRDLHPPTAWDGDNTAIFNIQLLSADVFEQVTGVSPPPSPVTAETYAAAGLPFYEIQGENGEGIKGLFSDVKSVGQLDRENRIGGLDKEFAFPTIQLDKTGQRVRFRPVDQLAQDVKAWGITTTF